MTPVICDFGEAKIVDIIGQCLCDHPGGNQSHLSPDILNEFCNKSRANPTSNVLLNYSKQIPWEFGIICHEITCGSHPFGDYPLNFKPNVPNLVVPPLNVDHLVNNNFPTPFIKIISDLLENLPQKRVTLSNALSILKKILESPDVEFR